MDTSCKPSSSSSYSCGSALHHEGPLGLGMCVRLPWPKGGGSTATHAGVPGGFTQLLTGRPNLWVETPLQPHGNEWALPPGLQ